ncbi:MAG: PAS domain S-box protein [Bacteroidota bacterium]
MRDVGNTNNMGDISILYELSLSIGQTLDLNDNVSKFVDLLLDRKNLDYVSVWIKKGAVDNTDVENDDYSLIYAKPMTFVKDIALYPDHKIFDYLNNVTSFQVNSSEHKFNSFLFENGIEYGTVVFFRLGDIGFLKLYKRDANHIPDNEVNKLDNLMQQFANSISACLYYEQALYETAERAKSENKYKNIFNSITDCYAEVDFFTGDIQVISPSIKTILGYSSEELIGKSINSFYSSTEDAKRIAKDILSSPDKEIIDYEVILISRVGKKVHCSYSMRLIYNENGKPGKIVGTMRDITIRKQSENNMVEAEEKWRALVGNSPDRILTVDRSGKVIFDNKKSENEIGIEQNVSSCLSLNEEQFSRFKKCYEDAFENKVVISTEINCTNNRWLLSRFVPVFQNDEVEFVMVIATDITEQKTMESELGKAIVDADAANKAKGIFLANMSHEIRNPMNAIIGNSNLLFGTSLNTEQGRMLNNLKLSADSLLEIIDKILDFSKIEADQLLLNKSTFLFKSEISKIYDSLQGIASNKTINFGLQIDDDIPKIVTADKARIKQVLLNLLNNAIKFTEDGGRVYLTCKLESIDGNNIRISFIVEDTGVGIDEDRLDEVFESFNQEDKSFNPKFGGTGLGLSISRHLVGVMGGNIMVESKKNLGSKFFFTIDLEIGSEDNLEDQTVYSPHNPHLLTGKTILVVEDSEFNQDVAMRILENWGGKVLIAENGQVAVEMIERSPDCADFVFMDIRMPIMDGIEATRIIRNKLNWKKPIVALTGEALRETIDECSNAGMDDFVSKPFAQETIEMKLRKFLDLPDKINAEGGQDTSQIHKSEDKEVVKAAEESVEVSSDKVVYSTEALMGMLGGSEEALKKILQKFIDETPARVVKMEESFKDEYWEQVQSQAHTIKTSLRYLKVDGSVDDCQNLEDLAKERVPNDGIKPLVYSIKNVVTRLIDQVKQDYEIS